MMRSLRSFEARALETATAALLSLAILATGAGCSKGSPAGGTGTAGAAAGGHREGEGHHDEDEHGEGEEHGRKGKHEEGVVILSPEAAALAKIEVVVATEQEIPLVLHTTAVLGFDQRRIAHISPRIPGRIRRVLRDLGDDVKAGDALAELDSVELGQAKAEYLGAKAEETLARKTLARKRHLFRQKITPEQSVIEAQSNYDKALAMLRSAAEKLRLLGLNSKQIKSVRYGDSKASIFPLLTPLDGRIVEKHSTLGELVSPETKVFTVADLGDLWVWIDVFERDFARVHLGDEVAVVTRAYPGRTFRGEVVYLRDEVDPDTRTARARIDIKNPDGLLKPGMFADVTVTDPHAKDGKTPIRKALALPASAVQRDGDGWIAFVREGKQRYERRALRIGVRTDALVEVLSGVEAGEAVVVQGTFLLKSEVAKEEMGGGHSH